MARAWYEKAALQRNAWAQAQLGQLYASGRGVPQDYTMARAWYEKAAAQGNAWAKAQLALL
jgi:TPR repeat protein